MADNNVQKKDSQTFDFNGVQEQLNNFQDAVNIFDSSLNGIEQDLNIDLNVTTDSGLYGSVASKLVDEWNNNCSIFRNYIGVFSSWNSTIADIAKEFDEFNAKVKEGEATEGLITVETIETEGKVSILDEQTMLALKNGILLIGGKKISILKDENGIEYVMINGVKYTLERDGKLLSSYTNTETGEVITFEHVSKESKMWELYVNYKDGKSSEWNEYYSSLEGEDLKIAERVMSDYNARTILLSQLGSYSPMAVGDNVQMLDSNGNLDTYTFDCFIQLEDMTQAQLFTKNIDGTDYLYYFDKKTGTMKEVLTLEDFTYAHVPATKDKLTEFCSDLIFDYDPNSWDADFLAYTNNNGTHTLTTEYKIGDYSIDITSSRDFQGKGVFSNKADFDGKGLVIYRPEASSISYDERNSDKDMMITSIIAVRNNMAKESAEMRLYVQENAADLSLDQISTILQQIDARDSLALRMGKDVTFGWTVDDGVIGDLNTANTTADAWTKALGTIDSYNEEILKLQNVEDILHQGKE